MMNKKIDFEIVPIFNQHDEIWHDFLYIEMMCDKSMGYNYNAYDKHSVLSNHEKDWKNNDYNFAFAAYRKTEMIGFAKGFLDVAETTYLDNLYVLPKYQGIGIGSELLTQVEKTSALISNCLSLMPLNSAVNFYKHNGYGWGDYCGDMGKYLSCFSDSVVPVFQWKKQKFQVKFSVKVDSNLLKQNKYQPVFAYINEFGKVDGVALRTKSGENKFWIKSGQNACKCELLKALDKAR